MIPDMTQTDTPEIIDDQEERLVLDETEVTEAEIEVLEEKVLVYTPAQAAERLGCSKPHIYRLITAGLLDAVDISAPGSRRTKTRILPEDLEAYTQRIRKVRVDDEIA